MTVFWIHLWYRCVKSVRTRSFSGLYFPAIVLNTERYEVFISVQSKCRKCAPEKLRIRTLFTQWSMFPLIPILSNVLLKSKKVFLQNWLTKANIRWESHGNLWKHSTYVNSVPVTTTAFQLRASDFQASYWITFSFTKYVYIGLNLLKL